MNIFQTAAKKVNEAEAELARLQNQDACTPLYLIFKKLRVARARAAAARAVADARKEFKRLFY